MNNLIPLIIMFAGVILVALAFASLINKESKKPKHQDS
jgi:hypothetical protein